MDYSKFLQQLPALYHNWGEVDVQPVSRDLKLMADQVNGTTTTSVMQMLNSAVGFLELNEVYCEIGCFQGRSVISAFMGHSQQMAYAVDSFAEMNFQNQNAEKLSENLAKFNLTNQVFFCSQEFEEFFAELSSLELEDRIGVFFYDAAQDYRSQLLAMQLVRPFLAEQAVIIINGSSNQFTHRAIGDFLVATPEAQLLVNLPEFKHDLYPFLDGVCVLAWNSQQTQPRDGAELQKQQAALATPQPVSQIKQDCLDSLLRQADNCKEQQQNDLAIEKYQQFLLWQPDDFQTWLNLGVLYLQEKRYFEALEAFTNIIEIDSSNALAHFNLGLAFENCGDLRHAFRAYRKAIACNPKLTEACNNLGGFLLFQGEPAQAEYYFRQSIAANPDEYAGYFNLGHALLAQANITEAITAYQTAQQLQPDNQDIQSALDKAIVNQANPINLYLECGFLAYQNAKYPEAISYLQKVLELDYGHPQACNTLSDCYKSTEQEAEAISILEHSLALYPDLGNQIALTLMLRYYGHNDRALALVRESLQAYPHALALQIEALLFMPLFYESHQEMLEYRQSFAAGLASLLQDLPRRINAEREVGELNLNLILQTFESNQFYLAYQGLNDLELQSQYGQLVQQLLQAKFPQFMTPRSLPPIKEKVRIGYLAENMKSNALGELYIGWLRHCNREEFEIYCYYTGYATDYMTQEFRQLSDYFHQIPCDAVAVCQQIIKDQLHILVYPGIGLDTNTLILAGLRLAPIQCTSWCHPVTTGLTTIDYFLSCESMETEEAKSHYSEKLVCLPKIGIAFPKPVIPPPVKTRADFGIPDQAIAYLSCQTPYKYQPQHDFIYPAIAQQVEQAKFVFLGNPSQRLRDKFISRVDRAFAEYELNSKDYCIFLPRIPEHDYIALNQVADIFLDTFGWSGGVTTLKAITCGLPVVTCPGEMMRSRHTYGILQTLGVTTTVAQTIQEYIDIAIRLALQPDWRHLIVAQMQLQQNQLYDDTTCVLALEDFFRQVTHYASANQVAKI